MSAQYQNKPWAAIAGSSLLLLITAALIATPAIATAEEDGTPQPASETIPAVSTEDAQAESPAEHEEASAEESPRDDAAIAYMQKCMGCHTIGGGALSGPDLKPTAGWPVNNLRDAVIRMEKNVGPLTPEEVETFTQFLLDSSATNRLATEQQRVALQQAAQLEPGSAEVGRELFFGSRPFQNRGLACASCHQAEGKGGNLAVSLEDVFTRMGEAPLISASEKPAFPVMKTIYAEAPLTKQEAVHVVKYLEFIASEPQEAATVPTHLVGIIGAIALMALLGRSSRKRAAGTRARLVAEAHRKNNLGGAGR